MYTFYMYKEYKKFMFKWCISEHMFDKRTIHVKHMLFCYKILIVNYIKQFIMYQINVRITEKLPTVN